MSNKKITLTIPKELLKKITAKVKTGEVLTEQEYIRKILSKELPNSE
jgi:Arc/MetJ-type ribon-helix-helix transcriptional regulator